MDLCEPGGSSEAETFSSPLFRSSSRLQPWTLTLSSLGGQRTRWRRWWRADRRRWTGRAAEIHSETLIKSDMIKHEVHHKGNVNLSSDLFIIKQRRRRAATPQIYEANLVNVIEGLRCY